MTTFDPHVNFFDATVAVGGAPSPALSGLTLTLTSGQGAPLAGRTNFNLVVGPAGLSPSSTTAEIFRVASVSGDVLTLSSRGPLAADPGGINRAIVDGDRIQLADTMKLWTDLETAVNFRAPGMVLG